MAAALADATVTAGAFSAVQFVEVAVHTNEEDVQVRQESGQFITPGRELDHMLDDQVVAGVGERWQAAVEPAKKRGRICVHQATTGDARIRVTAREISFRLFARLIQSGRRATNVIFCPASYQGARWPGWLVHVAHGPWSMSLAPGGDE